MQCLPADANRISWGQSLSINNVSKLRKDRGEEIKKKKARKTWLEQRMNEIVTDTKKIVLVILEMNKSLENH